MRRIVITALVLAGCNSADPQVPAPSMVSTPGAPSSRPVVAFEPIAFADRTSLAYILLLPADDAASLTRSHLVELVEHELGNKKDEPEVDILLAFCKMDPQLAQPNDHKRPHDLIGLHVETLEAADLRAAVPQAVLEDHILTRELTPPQRQGLPARTRGFLLRADYRNERALRGLRLLQTLVRLVATKYDALIHDPDTGETTNVISFTQRRLQAGLGNIADQVAVVPFSDRLHGDTYLRLTTRGMRRFGSPDLELDGLRKDATSLQQATFLLHGLAYRMARLAELDPSGYPIEQSDPIELSRADIVRAYSRQPGLIRPCEGCLGRVSLQIRKRAAQPQDPQDHLVVRVVAPPGDANEHDHFAWIASTLGHLFGRAGTP